jgi:hypothetical protein
MKDYEKIYIDLVGIFNIQLKEFTRQYKLSGANPEDLLSDDVEDFLVNKVNAGLDDLHKNSNAIQVAVAVFMTMLINNIEAEDE